MGVFPDPFGGDRDRTDADAEDPTDEAGDGRFDPAGEFVPASLPEPGPFLAGHEVLAGDDHVAFHAATREVFAERGVRDVTFGYNLARLNRDRRHPDAGYRYAVEADDPDTLRAEFTPTTEFCPQSRTLAVGSFRAWNDLRDRHGFDRVRVRVHPTHRSAASINEELAAMEGGDAGADDERAGYGDADGPAPR